MHPIQCDCGAIRGEIRGTGTTNRVICYCTDCRAFARFLGKPGVLDGQGGTEIVQLNLSRLTFLAGQEHLAAVRLSDQGMVRWFAACCKTPIGNTLPNPTMSFIGLIHSCLSHTKLDSDFGTHVALVNTDTAVGEPKPGQRGLLRVIARILWIAGAGRITGTYKRSALFDESGSPRVQPAVLTPAELAVLKCIASAPSESRS